MQKPFISIIVPSLNAENTIERCIKSLIDQEYPKNKCEIIVVDNNSQDATLILLQKYGNWITVLHENEQGSYRARNKAISYAKGQILAFTDSDCIADKNWLLSLSNGFRDKNVKIVGGRIRSFRLGSALLRYCSKFGHPQKYFINSKFPFFATSNMAISKIHLGKSRFKGFLMSGGDYELCRRIVKKNDEIHYEPMAKVRHCYSNSLIKFAKKNFFYGTWHSIMAKNQSGANFTPLPGLLTIWKKNGIHFLFLKILQDISFKLGICSGLMKNIFCSYRLPEREFIESLSLSR